MERLTSKSILGGWTLKVPRQEGIDRLAAYEDTDLEPEEIKDFMSRWKDAVELAGLCKEAGSDRLRELAEADEDGRIEITPRKLQPAKRGDQKPPCFYNDTAQPWCLGLAVDEDDYPIKPCQNCWYCEYNADEHEAAEAALEAQK